MNTLTFSKKSFKNSPKTFEVKRGEDGGRLGYVHVIGDQKWGVILEESHEYLVWFLSLNAKDNLKCHWFWNF